MISPYKVSVRNLFCASRFQLYLDFSLKEISKEKGMERLKDNWNTFSRLSEARLGTIQLRQKPNEFPCEF